MEFLTSFEEQCESRQSVERLRSHPMYDRFIAKWSLPVYFQIRLQDIAGHMEKSLQHPWELCKRKSPYKTTLVATVDQCVRRCWQDGVFLTSLTHRFWKLTLQLLSRYNTWLTAVAGGQVTAIESSGLFLIFDYILTICLWFCRSLLRSRLRVMY